MRPLRTTLAAATAAITLAGLGGLAIAAVKNDHVMTVRLPDGSMEQIRYAGDTAPVVKVIPRSMSLAAWPFAGDPFGPNSPFAALERASARMDRQAAALEQARLAPGDAGLTAVDLGKLPAGTSGFTMVSTMSGNGVCTRSVQYRSLGDGKPPQVISRSSGCVPATKDDGLATTSAKPGNVQDADLTPVNETSYE